MNTNASTNTDLETITIDENVNVAHKPIVTTSLKNKTQDIQQEQQNVIQNMPSTKSKNNKIGMENTLEKKLDFGGYIPSSLQNRLFQIIKKNIGFVIFANEYINDITISQTHQPPNILVSSVIRKWEILPQNRKETYDETARIQKIKIPETLDAFLILHPEPSTRPKVQNTPSIQNFHNIVKSPQIDFISHNNNTINQTPLQTDIRYRVENINSGISTTSSNLQQNMMSDTLPYTYHTQYNSSTIPSKQFNPITTATAADTDTNIIFQEFSSSTYQPTMQRPTNIYENWKPLQYNSMLQLQPQLQQSQQPQQPPQSQQPQQPQQPPQSQQPQQPQQPSQPQRPSDSHDSTNQQLYNRIRELEWQLLSKDDMIQNLETKIELQQQRYEIRIQQLRTRAIDAVKRMQNEAKKIVQEKNRIIEELKDDMTYLDTKNIHRKTSHLRIDTLDTNVRNELRNKIDHLRSINEDLQDQITTFKRTQHLLQEKIEYNEKQNDILYTTLENLQNDMQRIVGVYWLLTKMEVLPSHRGENLMRCRIINTTQKRQIEFDIKVETINNLTQESQIIPFSTLLQTSLPSYDVASSIHVNYIPRKIFSQYNDIPALYSDPFFFRANDSTTFQRSLLRITFNTDQVPSTNTESLQSHAAATTNTNLVTDGINTVQLPMSMKSRTNLNNHIYNNNNNNLYMTNNPTTPTIQQRYILPTPVRPIYAPNQERPTIEIRSDNDPNMEKS